MKKLLKILAVLLVLLIIVAVVFVTQINRVVKTAVESVGPKVLQAPVTIDDVDLHVVMGYGTLSGLTVGNPEGFRTENAFVLGTLKLKIDPKSLTTDTIHIEEILIDGPEITYEGIKGKNLKQLQANATAFGKKPGEAPAEEEAPPEEPEAPAKPAKKVVIDRLVLSRGKVNYSPAMGQVIPIPLPELELTGIGEKSGGATSGEVLVQVLRQIDSAILGSVANVGELAGNATKAGIKTVEGAADIGVDAVEGATAVGAKAIGSAADSANALVGKVPGLGGDDGTNAAISEAAGDLTESLGEAGESVTENIGESTEKLVGGIKGLFGGAKKDPEPEPVPAE